MGAAAEPGGNLLANGDFEAPFTTVADLYRSWSAWGFEVPQVVPGMTCELSHPHGGKACLRVHRPADPREWRGVLVTHPFNNAIEARDATRYKLSFWARSDRPGPIRVAVASYSQLKPPVAGPQVLNRQFDVGADWRAFQLSFTVGDDCYADEARHVHFAFFPAVGAGLEQDRTLWLDDVAVTAAAAATSGLINPKSGAYVLPGSLERAVREMKLPLTRLYALEEDEPFGSAEAALDKTAWLLDRLGIPRETSMIELEGVHANTKLAPEVWRRAVAHARDRKLGFRHWEIGNEVYVSIWNAGGTAFASAADYVAHVVAVSRAIEGTAPQYRDPARPADPELPLTPAMATITKDGSRLEVMLVNASATSDVPTTIQLPDFAASRCAARLLHATDPNAPPLLNGEADFVRDLPVTLASGKATCTLPARSVAFVAFDR